MKFGILTFPGSNCDHDCYHAVHHVFGKSAQFLWHKDEDIHHLDCIIIPGGFSYGDYLRCGAIAKYSPVMKSIKKFVENGGLVIGICNGFQILLESGLLPGAMLRNKNLKFICDTVNLKLGNTTTPFTKNGKDGAVYKMPIAHMDGNYYIDEKGLAELQKNNRIAFQYCDEKGGIDENSNPNGSLMNIAGIFNEEKNVLGMMPHPERALEGILGNEDGRFIFESMMEGSR